MSQSNPIITFLTLIGLSVCGLVNAQSITAEDTLWISGLGGEAIAPQFPIVDRRYELPDYPVANQSEWMISEHALGENTTVAEVTQRFSSSSGARGNADCFNNNLRVNFPYAPSSHWSEGLKLAHRIQPM